MRDRAEGGLPLVTVVIPNWNGLAHLPECLEALAAQTLSDFETIVVDNASTDDSVAWLNEHAPEVRVVQRADNGGFSAAVNAGVEAARGSYVALLNNDTAVDAEWLAALVHSLDAHPGYDIAASLMLFYGDPGRVNAAGDIYSPLVGMGTNRGFGEGADPYTQPVRVLGASAGAALYRRDVFDDVGPFDESFFLGAEDTDFNIRALVAGKKALFAPDARVRHKVGATRNAERSPRLERIETRNNGVIIGRDLPWDMVLWWVLRWPWRIFRDVVPLRPSKWPGFGERWSFVWRRTGAQLEGMRRGVGERREVWSRRRASRREIRRWLRHGVGPLD